MIIRRFARLINSNQRNCLSDQRAAEKAGTHVILSPPATGRRSEGSFSFLLKEMRNCFASLSMTIHGFSAAR
jgi:hypothetical protein